MGGAMMGIFWSPDSMNKKIIRKIVFVPPKEYAVCVLKNSFFQVTVYKNPHFYTEKKLNNTGTVGHQQTSKL